MPTAKTGKAAGRSQLGRKLPEFTESIRNQQEIDVNRFLRR